MRATTKRNSAIGILIVAAGLLVYWWFTSGSLLTLTKIPVEKTDALFGTTYIEWQDGFQLGLEYTAIAVVILLLTAGLFYRSYRKQIS